MIFLLVAICEIKTKFILAIFCLKEILRKIQTEIGYVHTFKVSNSRSQTRGVCVKNAKRLLISFVEETEKVLHFKM